MQKYRSIRHKEPIAQPGRPRDEEVEIVRKRTFLDRVLGKPERKEVWVGSGTVWYDKATGVRAGASKNGEIVQVVRFLRYNGDRSPSSSEGVIVSMWPVEEKEIIVLGSGSRDAHLNQTKIAV